MVLACPQARWLCAVTVRELVEVGPYAVLDVETTGLDPAHDAIIQVAVRRSDGREWSSFVNPRREVSLSIRQLTGFTGVDFTSFPTIGELKDTIESLVSGVRLVGHNVQFDVGFLTRAGLCVLASPLDTLHPLDTLPWSRLAFPLRAYHSLADWFNNNDDEAHLHDARVDVLTTERLLHTIYGRLAEFSSDLKRDLARFLGEEWHWWDVDMSTADRNGSSPLYGPSPDRFEVEPLSQGELKESAVQWLGPGGGLANAHQGFEVRRAQQDMAEAVEKALDQQEILMVQAGTGTGKSLAYLTPIIRRAWADGKRAVVATHTVALQEQLWLKDVPEVISHWPSERALVKGRGRYLCLYKASEVVQDSAVLGESYERRWALATLLSYIEASAMGDQEEFPLKTGTGQLLWREVMADSHSCAGSRCPYAGPCFMRRAHHQAESSHLVIVNHALLAAHVANGNVLPPFSHLVIDEAHHFQEVLESALGFELDRQEWERRYKETAHPSRGLFERLRSSAELAPVLSVLKSRYQDFTARLGQLAAELVAITPPGEYDRRSVRLTQDRYEAMQEAGLGDIWEQAVGAAKALCETSEQGFDEATAQGVQETPLWLRYRQWQQEIADVAWGFSLWGELSQERVSWWEVRTGRSGEPVVTWRWAPVDIAEIIHERLWSTVNTAVLTSATLAVGGRFDFIGESLGIPASRRIGLELPSPFDLEHQARIILPSDSGDPNERGYWDDLARLVQDVASRRGGRTLVLLTSYRAVDGIAWRIRPELEGRGIRTLAQNIDGPARQLVSEFRKNPRSVLVGTLTYWEGVDIPGDDLEIVVMGRLPFRSPGDPLEEAKLDRIRQEGRSPFYRRSLPQAVLRFQQGFGRLIRTQSDRGVVIVFDPRVRPDRSHYGKVFLDSVGQVPRIVVPSNQVVQAIDQFWEGELNANLSE